MAACARPPLERYILGESWNDWVEAFDDWSLTTGQAKKAEDVQVATLKSRIGGDPWKIFATCTFATPEDRKKVGPVKAKYRAYFEPQRNITYERHKFRSMKQGREKVDEWVTELRRQSARCDYGDLRDSVIRDQIVYGCAEDKCRERMLRENPLTLERAIEILRTAELTASQFKTMGSGPNESVHFQKGNDYNSEATNDRQTKRRMPKLWLQTYIGKREVPGNGQVLQEVRKARALRIKVLQEDENRRGEGEPPAENSSCL